MKEVWLVEIDPENPYEAAPTQIRATVVKVEKKTAHVQHDPGAVFRRKPWTMPVDRVTGRPPAKSDWAWRVREDCLPL